MEWIDTQMEAPLLDGISLTQQERLFHIDFRLRFLGSVSRADLVSRFGIKGAAATRDLALYRQLAPGNIEYDPKAKAYARANHFRPLFRCSPKQVLTALGHGLGDDYVGAHQPLLNAEAPTQLNESNLDTLACVTQAIYQRSALQVEYLSLSSGLTIREIVPFALVDNGLRWHIRAYDRKSERFADFVINRIVRSTLLHEATIQAKETKEADIQWNRIVEMHLVPHPRLQYPETIEYEYGMQHGMLKVNVRAAVAGYVLRRWNVDCSADHRLIGPEYHLWLKNLQTLYGVENLVIAPGYGGNCLDERASQSMDVD